MNQTYNFNVSKNFVHISHMISALWLVYIGYMTSKKIDINKINFSILLILGIILIVYFSMIIYKNYKKELQYAFGIHKNIIHATHILNGILFVLLGLKKIEIKDLVSLYMIIYGALGGIYHLHLMYLRI